MSFFPIPLIKNMMEKYIMAPKRISKIPITKLRPITEFIENRIKAIIAEAMSGFVRCVKSKDMFSSFFVYHNIPNR